MGKPTSLNLSLHLWSKAVDPRKVSTFSCPSLPQGPAAALYGKHVQGPHLTWRCPWHWWAAQGFYFTPIRLIGATISHSASQTCLCYLNGLSVAGDRSAIKERCLCLDLKWLQTVLSPDTWVTPELSRDRTGMGICLWEGHSPRSTPSIVLQTYTVFVCTCKHLYLTGTSPRQPVCCMF